MIRLNAETQITYYGEETAKLLERGFKIVTLRQTSDKYSGIRHGTEVSAQCPDDPESSGYISEVPLILIRNEQHQLKDIPDQVLLLDGFPNSDQALEQLSRFYPDLNAESLVQAIATIPYELWNKLTKSQQKKLISTELELSLKDPTFRQIFYPALIFWFNQYSDNAVDWANWLIDMDMITEGGVDEIIQGFPQS